jgi:hypothetical protein
MASTPTKFNYQGIGSFKIMHTAAFCYSTLTGQQQCHVYLTPAGHIEPGFLCTYTYNGGGNGKWSTAWGDWEKAYPGLGTWVEQEWEAHLARLVFK